MTDQVTSSGHPAVCGFNPSLVYSDVAFAAVLNVPSKSRQACIRELRATSKLIVDGINHPIARGEDWLQAYVIVTSGR